MKIQCDVCGKEEASVFCPADEAALCHGCDLCIHHANKLAGKHRRFSLHRSTSKEIPLCDICQKNRAFLFCQEDRAILCRECDIPIHRASELTQKHNRFLLTGVKLSGSSPNPASSSSGGTDAVTGGQLRSSGSNIRRPRSISNENICSPSMGNSIASAATCKVEDSMVSDTGSASSFSEYLIESIPGYCFEDLLDASFAPNGFCKNFEVEPKIQEQVLFPSEILAAWLPQFQAQSSSTTLTQMGALVGVKETPKANAAMGDWQWRYRGRTVSQLKKSRRCR